MWCSADEFERAADDYLLFGKQRGNLEGAYHAGVLYVMANNIEGYHESCRTISDLYDRRGDERDRLGTMAEQTAKTCLLMPGKYEAKSVEWLPDLKQREATGNNAEKQWTTNALALVAYRNQEYERAVEWIEKGYELRKTDAVDKGWCILLAIEAMTELQLGRGDEAKDRLAESRAIVDRLKRHAPRYGRERIVLLRDVYMAEIFCREAEALLSGSS